MGFARTKIEFNKAAEGLPEFEGIDLMAEVVCVEPVDAAYFSNDERQRCIIRRDDGKLYVTSYD